MSSVALRGAARRLVLLAHRWTGLALLVFLSVAALTGSILAFRAELEDWLNPGFTQVVPTEAHASVADVIARVEDQFPDASVSSVTLAATPTSTWSVYLQPRQQAGAGHAHVMGASAGAVEVSQVFVDPYSGRIVGQRNSRRIALDRTVLVPMLLQLHHSLLMSQTGKLFMGICAIFWLATSFAGLALAWPRGSARAAAWRPVVSVRGRRGSYLLNYDLHRATSVLLLPVSLVLAFTSVSLNLPSTLRSAVAAFSLLVEEPAPLRGVPCAGPVSPDAALRTALSASPGSSAYLIAREFGKGWYRVRLQHPDDIGPFGDSAAYIGSCTGTLVALKLAGAAGAGDRFLNWQYPLHTRLAFGRAGQLAIAFVGVALTGINLTGGLVWFYQWRRRRRRGESMQAARVSGKPSRLDAEPHGLSQMRSER